MKLLKILLISLITLVSFGSTSKADYPLCLGFYFGGCQFTLDGRPYSLVINTPSLTINMQNSDSAEFNATVTTTVLNQSALHGTHFTIGFESNDNFELQCLENCSWEITEVGQVFTVRIRVKVKVPQDETITLTLAHQVAIYADWNAIVEAPTFYASVPIQITNSAPFVVPPPTNIVASTGRKSKITSLNWTDVPAAEGFLIKRTFFGTRDFGMITTNSFNDPEILNCNRTYGTQSADYVLSTVGQNGYLSKPSTKSVPIRCTLR